MGVIQTLRNKGGKISVVVIALALFMFLVQDALSGRNSVFGRSNDDNSIGSIDGDKIDYKEFENKVSAEVDKMMKANPNQTIDEQRKEGVREQIWQRYIQDKIMKPQYDKLGIDVTGQEIYTVCTSLEFATEEVKGAFTPQGGTFDPNAAKSFLKRLDDDATGEIHTQWAPFEEYLTTSRLINKYNAMAKSGVYVTTLEVKNQFNDANKKVSFQYVSQQYANYSDTTIKVTPDEVTAYYNKNKEKYKREDEVRKLNYVYFDFIPSSEDTAEVNAWAKIISEGFSTSKNDSEFVSKNGGVYNPTAMGHGEMDPKLEDSLFNAPVGKVVGPYEENGEIKIAKLVNTKEDTITYYRASHILVKVVGSTAKDTADAIAKATEYMNDIKSGKKTFSEMAMQYGTDGTASKGGDLGWFKPGNMVKEFEDAVKRTPAGQMTVAKTQFGAHVIKVTYAPTRKKIVIATLSKKVLASQKTLDAAYNSVADLASRSKDYETFAAACKERNIPMRTTDLSNTSRNMPGLQNPKSVLSWAYRAKKDEVSSLYTVDDKYVLACLKEILPEGYMSQDEISDLQALALKDKKGKVLVEKFNENLKNAQTPEQLAISFGSVAQDIRGAVFANSYLEYIGNEPEVLANMVTLPKQKFSKPIQGANGVYVIYVTEVLDGTAPDPMMIKAQQDSKINESKQRTETYVTEALKTKYKVKDFRYRY